MQDASFVTLADGQLGIAGVNTRKKYSSLEVYPFEKRRLMQSGKIPVYSRSFEPSLAPQNISY